MFSPAKGLLAGVCTLAGLALTAGQARAEATPITIFGYDVSITVQGATASAYQGSKHYSGFPSISIAATRPGHYDDFGAPDDSPSIVLWENDTVQVGGSGNFIADRGNSHALVGMKDLAWAGEGGGFFNWWPQPWMRVRVEALRGLWSEDGWLVNGAADFVTRKGPFILSAGPRINLADAAYNDFYFGVTPAEAVTSLHYKTAFSPGASPLTGGVEAAVEYAWHDRWRFDLSANYDRILGQDANSPIVRLTGSPNQYSIAGGVRFMLSKP